MHAAELRYNADEKRPSAVCVCCAPYNRIPQDKQDERISHPPLLVCEREKKKKKLSLPPVVLAQEAEEEEEVKKKKVVCV